MTTSIYNGEDCAVCNTLDRVDQVNDDDDPAHLKIHKVVDDKYAIFTAAGDYVETVGYDQAKPLILYPSKRAQYLRRHLEDLS